MPYCPRCQSPLSEPPDRFCPNCGLDLVAPPAATEAPPEALHAGGGAPWEQRQEIGFFSALVETTQQVLLSPTSFFRSMAVTGGIASPLLYAFILGYLGLLVTALYDAIMTAVLGVNRLPFPRGPEFERLRPLLEGGVGFVAKVALGPILVVLLAFLMAGIVHLALLLLGGARRGFEATFRVLAYSDASNVLTIVPVCGGIASLVYFVVLATIGLSEAHGIGRGKAAAAVLLPLVLLCCCCAGLIALALGLGFSALSQMR